MDEMFVNQSLKGPADFEFRCDINIDFFQYNIFYVKYFNSYA